MCDKEPPLTCTEYETEKFVGGYNVGEFCQQGFGHNYTYAYINEGQNSINELMIMNFLNSGHNVFAYLSCDGVYFQIPDQNLGSSAFTVAGEGSYYDYGGYIQLQFDVQINEFGQANYCSYTFTR